jgi:DME family drug/metabolite transporter
LSIALAAVAAICFATAGVFFKRGIVTNSLATALLLSLPIVVIIAGGFAMFDLPKSLSFTTLLWFIAGGLVGDGVARASFIGAVDRLGPSVVTPIQTASYPVVALGGGILFLSESVSPWRIIGAGLIVGGIWAVAGSPHSYSGDANSRRKFQWRWVYLMPVLAGVTFGIADVMRKFALEDAPYPAFGAAVGTLSAAVVWFVVIMAVPDLRRSATPAKGWGWFVVAAVFIGLGLVSVFTALEGADVSVVGPIISVQPLAVVALSPVFLREHEVITKRLVLGAALTVAGVISLTV